MEIMSRLNLFLSQSFGWVRKCAVYKENPWGIENLMISFGMYQENPCKNSNIELEVYVFGFVPLSQTHAIPVWYFSLHLQ